MAAVPTMHVIAALVFFDEALAFGAGFGVGFDPGDVFAGVLLLESPQRNLMTSRRLVILLLTFETECIATITVNYVYHAEIAQLNNIFTRFLWAPFHIFIEVCELFAVPINVFAVVVDTVVINFIFEVLQEERMRYNYIATKLCAFCEYALWADTLYLILQIHPPANLAKLMPAA